jgi:outer membrane protein
MRLLGIIGAAALAAAALGVASEASAQRNRNNASSVVVFNYQRVIAESNAGRAMLSSLQSIGQQINTELQALGPELQSLQQEQQRIERLTRDMNAEQRRNNSQVQAFAQRAQQFQTRRAQLEGDMECTRALTLRSFNDQLLPILRQVTEARGAGVVLDAASVQYNAPQFDVTNEVLQRVNTSIPSVSVTRRPYTECVQQQQQQSSQ